MSNATVTVRGSLNSNSRSIWNLEFAEFEITSIPDYYSGIHADRTSAT